MLVIFDRDKNSNRITLLPLLDEIAKIFKIDNNEEIRILRIDGVGPELKQCESLLDGGNILVLSMSRIRAIATSQNEIIHSISCSSRCVSFGISDSSFMFVQGIDKTAESAVAKAFSNIKQIHDRDII
jgi:hypothetical protein